MTGQFGKSPGPPREVRRATTTVATTTRPATLRPFQVHLGQLAHAAIGACLLDARRSRLAPTVNPSILAAVLEADPLHHDRRRGQILLRSYVRSYIETFLPPPPWRLVATERRLGTGRIDLLFRNSATGEYLGDELKTARGKAGVLDPEDCEQIARYLALLELEFGHRLQGVRLVRLGPPTEVFLFRSSADPRLRLADQATGWR